MATKKINNSGFYETDLTPKKKRCSRYKKLKWDVDGEFQESDICYECFVKMGMMGY